MAGLWIADLEEEDGTCHEGQAATSTHHGFSSNQIEHYFHEAGFTSVSNRRIMTVVKERDEQRREYPVNLTVGTVGPALD